MDSAFSGKWTYQIQDPATGQYDETCQYVFVKFFEEHIDKTKGARDVAIDQNSIAQFGFLVNFGAERLTPILFNHGGPGHISISRKDSCYSSYARGILQGSDLSMCINRRHCFLAYGAYLSTFSFKAARRNRVQILEQQNWSLM